MCGVDELDNLVKRFNNKPFVQQNGFSIAEGVDFCCFFSYWYNWVVRGFDNKNRIYQLCT